MPLTWPEALANAMQVPALAPVIETEINAIDAEIDAIGAATKPRPPSVYLVHLASLLEHSAKILREVAPLADSLAEDIKD